MEVHVRPNTGEGADTLVFGERKRFERRFDQILKYFKTHTPYVGHWVGCDQNGQEVQPDENNEI